jgi:integrase
VSTALDLVLKYQRDAKRAPATVRASTYHARHLIEHLGSSTPLASVTLADTTSYMRTRIKDGAHRHTVAKEIKTLTQAMRRAEKLGLYRPSRSPTHYFPDELTGVYKPRDRWMTRGEYEALLDALAPNPVPTRNQRVPKTLRRRADRQDRRDYVIAYCHLGLRKSELSDMQPDDFDAKRLELRVRGTKTDGADRLVPVNPEAAEVLRRRCVLAKPFPEWTDGSCVRDLARACVRAGIARVTPNDLRRTFCSWLCQAGVPERVCAELMGHESTVMVRAVYGHLDRVSMASAVSKIAAATRIDPVTAAVTAQSSASSLN